MELPVGSSEAASRGGVAQALEAARSEERRLGAHASHAGAPAFLIGLEDTPELNGVRVKLEEPLFAAWAQAIAAFSMWPLLKKDGQGVAYCALLLLHAVVSGGMGALLTGGLGALRGRPMHLALCASLAGAAALHAAEALVPPPASKPFLHDALNAAYSAAHVLAALAYGTWRQWQCPADEEEEGRLSRGKAKVA